MGDVDVSHSHRKLDFRPDSKLDYQSESRFTSGIDSFGSKLALRASLRYTGEDDQWQTHRGSLRERNKHMFNCELFSDVRFLVGRTEKMAIPAHRYVLSISSPVFSSLFYAFGALQAEQNNREQIELSECEPDSFLELLRYMYYDEVQLTTNNAPEVLFLARKYLVPSLAETCTKFILDNLAVENTLPVLNHCCLLGVSKGLENKCWTIIDENASQIAEDDEFAEIDHATLTAFLSRDTLVAKETVLFRAAVKWAGRECQRMSIPLTVENKRRALGDAFYSIRFPLMSMSEFTDEVARSSFLNYEEVANMYIGYNDNFRSCNIRFLTEPRAEPAPDKPYRCPRFESTMLRPKWNAVIPQECVVKFKVSQQVGITGVALFTALSQSSTQPLNVELRDGSGSILSQQEVNLDERDERDNRDDHPDVRDVFFPSPVVLESDVIYSISVKSQEVLERYGEGPIDEVTCEGVDFVFLREHDEETEYGQVPELLFTPLGGEEETLLNSELEN